MKKVSFRLILVTLLLGITIFSAFKYASSLKERYDLINAVKRMDKQVAALEGEKQALAQELEKERGIKQKLVEENMLFEENIKTDGEKVSKLNSKLVSLQQELEQLNARLASLKEERDNLSVRLTQAVQERDSLQIRLSSIPELKKAIADLKRRMHKANAEIKNRIKHKDSNIYGNRGFLIKDGKSTYPTKIKIEIISVPKIK